MKRIHHVAIIGAGPAGVVIARMMADAGKIVTLYEKRGHIAGNCFDKKDEHDILIHPYGPHYFRTNDESLLNFLSRFTQWHSALYLVRAKVDDTLIPLPISLSTMTKLKGFLFTEKLFCDYLKKERIPFDNPKNAEEQCLSLVGNELYEKIFKNYTIKQWGTHPSQLAPSVTARIPLRMNFDERYPSEIYQIMPKDGYTQMYKKMLSHEKINLQINTEIKSEDVAFLKKENEVVFYTGQLDEYFNFCLGKLPYRSLHFEWKHFEDSFREPCVQINYPNEYEFTRTVEIKHVTGQSIKGTTICTEFPRQEGLPFYPILSHAGQDLAEKYALLASEEAKKNTPVHFIGRLAEFKYYNVDQIMTKAIGLAKKVLEVHNEHTHKYKKTCDNHSCLQ